MKVSRAIKWLRDKGKERESVDYYRYAATLVLKQMAQNAPAMFNVHVRSFIAEIWHALRSPSREIRESAVDALSVSFLDPKLLSPFSDPLQPVLSRLYQISMLSCTHLPWHDSFCALSFFLEVSTQTNIGLTEFSPKISFWTNSTGNVFMICKLEFIPGTFGKESISVSNLPISEDAII